MLRHEAIALAWIAAMQTLPPVQRAAVVLKDVLGFRVAEIAALLERSVPAVNSALQRGRARLAQRSDGGNAESPDPALVERFVASFTTGDVDDLVDLLAADVRFTMPPLPGWFDGRDDVAVFLAERVFATPWRARHVGFVNGVPAVVAEQLWEGSWRPGALMLLHFGSGHLRWLATFVEPSLVARWIEDVHSLDR